MTEFTILYQTISKKHSREITEMSGPVYCPDEDEDSWLGDGYYFWDTHIELGHQWGRNWYLIKRKEPYYICQTQCALDQMCFDMHGNGNRRIEFENYVNNAAKLLNKKVGSMLVRDIVVFMRSKIDFTEKYNSIRILGTDSFKFLSTKENIIPFQLFRDPYYQKYPPVQLCFFEPDVQSRSGFSVVYEHPDLPKITEWA